MFSQVVDTGVRWIARPVGRGKLGTGDLLYEATILGLIIGERCIFARAGTPFRPQSLTLREDTLISSRLDTHCHMIASEGIVTQEICPVIPAQANNIKLVCSPSPSAAKGKPASPTDSIWMMPAKVKYFLGVGD